MNLFKPSGWQGIPVVVNGLPADARPVAMYHDYATNTFGVVIESDTFEEVPEGERLPEMPPLMVTSFSPPQEALNLPLEYYIQRAYDSGLKR